MCNKRKIRMLRLRKKLLSFQRIRLFFFKSNKYIYAYVIDDLKKKILFSESTYQLKNIYKNNKNITASNILANKLVLTLKKKNINSILFDRSGYKYHGNIKEIANILKINKIIFG